MTKWQDVTPQSLLELMENGQIEANQIIDVREPFEWEFYHLEQSTLIPMQTISLKLDEWSPEKPLYIVCAHGVRSIAVCEYLHREGYSNLHNITGGMAAIASLKGFQYD